MSNRRIVVAGLVFTALLGLVFLDQYRTERRDRLRTRAERLLPFEREAIGRIRIKRLRDSVELVREGGTWKLAAPIKTEADPQSVNELLFTLDRQQRIGAQPATEDQLRSFGLEQPPLRVEVASDDGPSLRFHVGEDSPVFGEAYAALDGHPEYFTVSADLKRNLSRSLETLRDRSLVAFNVNAATAVTLILQGDTTIRAVREDADWRLVEPIEAPADANVVNGILQATYVTKAQDFIDTDTLDLKKYGLDVPTVVAYFEGEAGPDPQRSTLTIGRVRDVEGRSYYAKRQDRSSVFAVPEGLVFALIPEVAELRVKDVFTLAREDIRTFELEFAGDTIRLRLDEEGRWKFEDDAGEAADANVVTEALRYLMTMRVKAYLDFQPTPEMAGLDPPRLRVTVGNGSGRTESIETGRSGKTSDDQGIVYARTSPEGEIFGVPIELPGKLFLTREKFLNKTIFAFTPSAVASVKYTVMDPRTGQEAAYLFTREGEAWVATAVRTAEQAQIGRNVVESMLLHMLALQWANRLDPEDDADLAAIRGASLEAPPLLLELFDADQKRITAMGLGPQQSQRFFHIRRDVGDRTDYYAVDRTVFLPFAAALRELLQP